MPHVICYVLISDGVHPGKDIYRCERARPQIETLKTLAADPDHRIPFRYDYKRKVRNLSQLPVLARSLREIEKVDGFVAVECLARLLQKPDLKDRAAFLDELMHYRTKVFGVRQRKRLDDYTHQGLLKLLTVQPPKRQIAATIRRQPVRNTVQATSASKSAKMGRSRKDAAILAAIRQELTEQKGSVTLKAIAEEANARGHRNQRGGPWTEQAVHIRLGQYDAKSP